MSESRRVPDELIEKIRQLPADKIAALADFVDFLYERDARRHLARAASRVSEASFARVWSNPEDADYDSL